MSETWVGRVVGGYEIESVVGKGALSTVYRAYQPQLDRRVALKVLKAGEQDNQAFLETFRSEAQAIAGLRHPNILAVFDYGETAGTAYIVMEYIAGGTLEQFMDGQPRQWKEVADLIIPVAHALAHAHAKEIVHCDVKPANILLPRPDWPLLSDFGLLRIKGDQHARKPGMLWGTPTYASPEQILGEFVGPQSDIYSLALILYELLTGKAPFEELSPSSLILQRLLEYPTPPSQHNPEINPLLETIILESLARQAADRYESMDALIDDLMTVPGTDVTVATVGPEALEQNISTKRLSEHPATEGPHLVVTGTATVLSLPLKRELILGRSAPSTDTWPDVDLGPHGGVQAGVSRKHARLRYGAEGWLLEDLGSTNGTSINMDPLEPGNYYRLNSGDVIRCGRMTLVFFED